MRIKRFRLANEQNQVLTISWKGNYKNTTIMLEDKILGSYTNRMEYAEGKAFFLDNGDIIRIELLNPMLYPKLQVYYNGVLLNDSKFSPTTKEVKSASNLMYFLGFCNGILGFMATFMEAEILKIFGIGIATLIQGIVFIILGYFARKKSKTSLMIGMGLIALDLVLTFIFGMLEGKSMLSGGVTKIAFLILIYKGLMSVDDHKDMAADF